MAGLDEKSCKKLEIPVFDTTDAIDSKLFETLIPEKFKPRRSFMSEILKLFCVETAKQKNTSFRYFMETYIEPMEG